MKVLAATGDVMKLEQAQRESGRPAGSKNFEDTVISLSAAIHLLNTRLGKSNESSAVVDLSLRQAQGKAA